VQLSTENDLCEVLFTELDYFENHD